ncbi:MAG: IPT/TIG domain-containing protein [Acidobacteriota bacterium]
MLFSLYHRFSARSNQSRLKVGLSLLLIFSLSLALFAPNDSAAQGECKVEASTTVPASAAAGEAVNFAATTTASGCASAVAYEWDFGDGTARGTTQNPAHTYVAPGVYNWRLSAIANNGVTTIDTVAGGYGDTVGAKDGSFTTPIAIARDPQGRGIYVSDQALTGNTVRFLNTTDAAVTIAGKLVQPGAMRVLTNDSALAGFQNIWNRDPAEIGVTGSGLAVNGNGNLLYLADQFSNAVWVLNVSASVQSVFGTSLNPGTLGLLARVPSGGVNGITVHPVTGEVYVSYENFVRKISAVDVASVVAGNGATTSPTQKFPDVPTDALQVPLLQPRDLTFDTSGNLYIADARHARVVKLEPTGLLSLTAQYSSNSYPAGLAFFNGKLFVADGNAQNIARIDNPGSAGNAATSIAGTISLVCDYTAATCGDGGVITNATFNLQESNSTPAWIGLEADANGLYVLDQGKAGRGRVRYLNLSASAVTLAGTRIEGNQIDTIAGTGLLTPFDGGVANGAVLGGPNGVAADAQGNLWIANTLRASLRFVNRGQNAVTLFAGTRSEITVLPGQIVTINKDAGPGATDNVSVIQAAFDTPQGLFVTDKGVFVADSKFGPAVDNKRTGSIRFINTSNIGVTFYGSSATPIVIPPGNVGTIVGGNPSVSNIGDGGFATGARLLAPSDVVLHPTTGDIYVADPGNKAVRKINANTGVVSSLNLPPAIYTGVGMGADGRLYVASYDGDQVLRESASGSGIFAAMNTTPIVRPRDVAVDASGVAFVAQSNAASSVSNQARIVRLAVDGTSSVIAGDTPGYSGDGGPAVNGKLAFSPDDVSIGTLGGNTRVPGVTNITLSNTREIIVADSNNDRIRRIAAGTVTTIKTGSITITGNNPVPTVSKLSPTLAVLGRAFTLTVTGTGFVPTSKVRWDGQERVTTYVSSTQLTALISANDVTAAAVAAVSVINPAPGGGISNPVTINVGRINAIPSLSSLLPNKAAVGAAFILTVNGTGFTDTSVVRWNGSDRVTTFISPTTLQAQIPRTDLPSAGTANVSVFTPEPGGGLSTSASFIILATNPAPTLSSFTPNVVTTGLPGTQVVVTGTNFAVNSVVHLNGVGRDTVFISERELRAQLTAADFAQARSANVTVVTPTPGGGVSAALPLLIGPQVANVPAASFSGSVVTPDSIVALFGSDLTNGTEVATSVPLPTTLRDTTVTVRDAAGIERLAPLFFVSPGQINFLVPTGTQGSQCLVLVKSGAALKGVGSLIVVPVAPVMFSADATGRGTAAGVALRVKADGAQSFEPLVRYDSAQQRFVPVPLDLGPETEQVYLILYGAGFRQRTALPLVRLRTPGSTTDTATLPVLFAGEAPGFFGLDQLNVGPLPRRLAGDGVQDVIVSADSRTANLVQITFK